MRAIKSVPIALLMMFGMQSSAIAEPATDTTAAFNVTPLRLEMPSGQDATQMLVRNDSAQMLAIQIRLFRWDQERGTDRYNPSEDFIISPSIVKIAPHRTQTLHIIASTLQLAEVQTNYRVVIDQLPQNVQAIAGASQTRLRLTVPLFGGGDLAIPAQIGFSITKDELLISNLGKRTAKIGKLAIEQAASSNILPPHSSPRYIHGGATLRVALPEGVTCDGTAIKILGIVDREAINAIPAQNCS